ncbi:MAG: helix-turn-helix transcriptional regulator [Oscillospiraceae bacterium]|nr:helix-turn-helix transcriptional regulator [Oscillospiraceae bacterium]
MKEYPVIKAKYYDENPALAKAYAPVFSYSHDVKSPILWLHYVHQQSHAYTAPTKNKEWCSLFIFLSGKCSILIGEHLYTPTCGDAILIRNSEDYTSIFPDASYIDYYQFIFPTEFFNKINISDLFSKPFYDRKLSERNLISPNYSDCNKLFTYLNLLDEQSFAKSECRDLLMYSLIIQIAEIIYSSFSSGSHTTKDSKIPKKLNDAIYYIHNYFTTLDGISKVCTACNVSNVYLARIFKNHLNCTPNEYVTKLRISHAKYLLSNGKSITDVCFESGFNNYTYFISKFKQLTGITPSKFIKQAKHLF